MLVLAQQKHSFRATGARPDEEDNFTANLGPGKVSTAETEANGPIPLQQMHLPAGTVAVARPRDRWWGGGVDFFD